MSARVLPVVLAFAAMLSTAPVLPSVPAAAAAEPGKGVAPASVPAEPGRAALQEALRGVDWTAFTKAAVRDRMSAQAVEVDERAEARGRDAVRAELARNGSSAAPVGEPVAGGTELQRIGALGNRWTDTCSEPGVGRVDLRASLIAQSIDDAGRPDQTAFLAYACAKWQPADLEGGSITWALYPDLEKLDFPEFLVTIYSDQGELRIAAVRSPSADPASWYLTWLGDAERLDDYEIDGVVPTKAIGDVQAAEFGFVTTVVDASSAVDVFPEGYMTDLPVYPRACEGGLALADVGISQASAAEVVPNDRDYARQWALPAVGAPPAWAQRAAADVLVAVIDDGVDGRRADFGGRVVAGYDSVYGQQLAAGSDSDRGSHGTAVAGVLAAGGNNGREIAGVNWGARILPIRVVDANGCITATAVAAAIDHAVERGAQVINMSLGGPDDDGVREAVDKALSAGITVVAAAGNSGNDSAPFYPATLGGVIAVGATERSGAVTAYSGTGRHLDVVAPGGNASGSADEDILVPWDLGTVSTVAGTSFSAPLVSGAVSLYLGEHPHATTEDVRLALAHSAVDLGVAGHDIRSGYGLLDIDALLQQPAAGPLVADPATGELDRVDATDPGMLPIRISQLRYPEPESATAKYVVLSRDDVFADSLAGASLTADGPLLVTSPDHLDKPVAEEITRLLGDSGLVYLLGGTNALSEGVAEALTEAGFTVERLQGASRVETAVAVAREVHKRFGSGDVAVARAYSGNEPTSAWADSVTGGAWAASAGVPVLVTGATLHPAVARYLSDHDVQRTFLLGGTAAVTAAVEAAVPAPVRVAGEERAGTAAAVATQLWDSPAGYLVANGYESSGWVVGLAGAGLAADRGTPLLLVDRSRVPAATAELAAEVCDAALTLLGDDSHVGGSVESELAALAKAESC